MQANEALRQDVWPDGPRDEPRQQTPYVEPPRNVRHSPGVPVQPCSRGRFHFDSVTLPAGFDHGFSLKVSANLGIRGADLAFEVDRTLLQPQSLQPSSQVMTATAGAGPDLWLVDLGVSPQDPVTLSTILDVTGQWGLGAGLVNDLAVFSVTVTDVAQETETWLSFDPVASGGLTVTVSGGIQVPASPDQSLIRLVVPTPFL